MTDVNGKPVPGASVSALVRRPWAPGDRGLRDDVVAKVTTDADGRYAVVVPADFATHYPERSVTLLVSGSGLPPTTKTVRLGAGGADVGVPATRTVSGVLIALDGKPADGVKVAVVRLGQAAMVISAAPTVRPRLDETVWLGFDQDRLHLFDAATGVALA